MKKETQNLKEQNKVPFYLKDYPNICQEFQGEIKLDETMRNGRIAFFLIMFIFFSSMVLMEGIKDKTVLGSIILIQVILAAVWLGPDMVKICKCLFMKEKLAQLEGYLGGEKEEISWGWKHTYVTEDSHLIFCSHIIPLEGLTKVLYQHLKYTAGPPGKPFFPLYVWLIFCYEDGKTISVQEERLQPRHFKECFDYAKLKAAVSNEERDVEVSEDKSVLRKIVRMF